MPNTDKSTNSSFPELFKPKQLTSLEKKEEMAADNTSISLDEERLRLRALVHQSRSGVVVLTSAGAVYEANRHYADMLGYTPEELYNLYIWDWDRKYTKETLLDMVQSVNETGDHFITKHTRKDGSTFDAEIRTAGTLCAGQKLVFCTCKDVTEKISFEKELLESKELLGTFIDHFRGIAYQVALDDIYTFKPQFFRGAIERITGFSDNEFYRTISWNDIIHPEDINRLSSIRNNFLHNQQYIAESEYRIIRKDASIRWMHDIAQIVTIGNTQLIHGTIFDITERKKAEETALKLEEQIRHSQKLEAIGTLAGGIAHDFNNILGIIMGFNDLALAELPQHSKTYDKLKHIRKASIRAREIIKQLLTFSKKVASKKQPLDICTIILETMTFLRSTFPAQIHIDHNFIGEDLMIFADPTQLHQVIMNLCVNASQALEDNGGTIVITAEHCTYVGTTDDPFNKLPDGRYIKISVSDNGPGINPKVIGRIFEPYFTTRGTGNGSGLGLAVVHGIIENHEGAITVSSNPALGTIFSIMIPAYHIKVPDTNPPLSTVTPTGVESVLFIDDEEGITTIAQLILEAQGFHVTTSTDPLVALDIFRRKPSEFDIVVTDMNMPYLNGDQVFAEIKKIRTDIPVVLCTGHSARIDDQKAAAMGIAAFIIKPLGRQELIETIRNVLDGEIALSPCPLP